MTVKSTPMTILRARGEPVGASGWSGAFGVDGGSLWMVGWAFMGYVLCEHWVDWRRDEQ